VEKPILRKREKVLAGFRKFLPPGFEDIVVDLFLASPVKFKIVPPRKTKLGDFRIGHGMEKPQITVNGDLNPYSFLITTLHEFAHLHTFQQYGNRVNPHGEEWKKNFRNLLIPIIDTGNLPKDIEIALVDSLVSIKASSCSDQKLSRVLKNYDEVKDGIEILERLPKNTIFALNGREFIKGELRRKRFLCEETISKRMFLVNSLAEVYPIKKTN
jgi:SprT protein